MTGKVMRVGMRGEVLGMGSARAAAIAAVAGMALACVAADRAGRDAEADTSAGPAHVVTTPGIDYDTIPTAAYTIFETRAESDEPRKLLIRVMVLGEASTQSLGKTMRQVMDSIAAEDTALAAARGILYTGRSLSPGRVELTPMAHALWVPPEGWDDASTTAAEELHRTYVYFGDPGWIAGDEENDAGRAGSED